MNNKSRLFSPGALKPAEALLEFPVCHLDDGENVIDVGPWIVFALMPTEGTLL